MGYILLQKEMCTPKVKAIQVVIKNNCVKVIHVYKELYDRDTKLLSRYFNNREVRILKNSKKGIHCIR